MLGYETKVFINNIGSKQIFLKAYITFSIFTILLSYIFRNVTLFRKFYNKIFSILFFNFILRFLIEGYLDICISAILNLQGLKWNSQSNIYSSLLSCGFITIIGIYPFLALYLLWKNLD